MGTVIYAPRKEPAHQRWSFRSCDLTSQWLNLSGVYIFDVDQDRFSPYVLDYEDCWLSKFFNSETKSLTSLNSRYTDAKRT